MCVTLEADILAIRRKVHDFWVRREVPNLDKILQVVNDDEELPSFSRSSLHRLLKGMEFRFIKRKWNSALIDKQHIVSWRQNYIKNIRELREEGRPIYYLDETWYNCGDVVNKLWVDTTVTSPRNAEERRLSTGLPAPANKGKRLIILHIGSEDGFLPGGLHCFESKKNTADYHNEMNGDTFLDWFKKILPTLRDRAVIVMDNAPYHSVIKEPHPKMIWKKARIVEWLQGKGETIDADLVKTLPKNIGSRAKPML
ncbi:uncharacterized protein LOC143217839 [Lasioglossum baleicum]|uniref:uncharacterized protein LOC143217839 n=1 Tax=Lasioglossum baleicum TaxID=434251 RepID=UPI003FCD67C9